MNSEYQPPVSKLLRYGDCRNYRKWPNYVKQLSLEEKHIPELIRMATDEKLNQGDSESLEVWSPVHAWRALGQLKAKEAIKPLLTLLNDQDADWISSDFPTLCTLIGVDSIPLLKEFLGDASNDFFARADVAQSLEAMSQKYPETRESNIAAIAGELEKFRENDPMFNGLLIGTLVRLNAVETSNLIEQAFKAKKVDSFMLGDWEDVQLALGLITREELQAIRLSACRRRCMCLR